MTAADVPTAYGFCFQELIGPPKPRACLSEAAARAQVRTLLSCGNDDACVLESVNGGPWTRAGGVA